MNNNNNNNGFNIDNETIKNFQNMVGNNGDMSKMLSNISPEMIQNFSNMMNSNKENISDSTKDANNSDNDNNIDFNNLINTLKNSNLNTGNNNNDNNNNNSNTQNFDFSNLDMKTIMKISSVMSKINNNKNDSRSNLLNSLKPYLRNERKGKVDQYANLLNMTKLAEIFKEDKESND